MKTVNGLIEELDDWIFIGIDSDIYECKSQRPEYQHLVVQAEALGLEGQSISHYVLGALRTEARLPFWKQKTLWLCFKIWVKKLLRMC